MLKQNSPQYSILFAEIRMNEPHDIPTFWKRCSSCKKDIGFSSRYYLCSVSTCRHPRTGMRFCSVPCWDAHLGFANHRGGAWAEEVTSPSLEAYLRETEPRAPTKKVVDAPSKSIPSTGGTVKEREIDTLVVVSKVKKLIVDESGFSTSQCCIDALTERVVQECRKAIEHARAAGRKTVMGRDIR
jgi:histone H3/H4